MYIKCIWEIIYLPITIHWTFYMHLKLFIYKNKVNSIFGMANIVKYTFSPNKDMYEDIKIQFKINIIRPIIWMHWPHG